jgi:prevent-host-death family protein
MKKTVNTADVRQRLGDMLDRVKSDRDEFVIERRGEPLAVLVPVEKLERLQRAAELELLDRLDGHRKRLTQSQIDDLSNTAKHRSRGKR